MHPLFISEYYPPKVMGGGEINLSTLAKALVKSKHTVSILTAHFTGLPAYEEQEGVKIYRRLKTGNNPGSLLSNIARSLLFPRSIKRKAAALVSEINPDIIHFIGTSIIAAPKLKLLNKPLFATIESYPALCPKGDRWYHGKEECRVVCTFRKFITCQKDSDEIGKMKNKWYFKYNPLFSWYVYRYYKKLNHALSYCTLLSISKYVQQLLLLHGHHSTVIPNILDLKPFSAAGKGLDQAGENKKTHLLYLGSLIKSKGPHILLEALKGLECRCDLYGEGNMKQELQEYIDKNNLDAEIHPPVPYDRVPELYAQADIIIFPSLWPEPFGRIAIEAMAAGKLIIGSMMGAIKETISPSFGTLVNPGDYQELREVIEKCLERRSKVKNSIAPHLEQYDSQNVTIKLIKVYQEAMNHG